MKLYLKGNNFYPILSNTYYDDSGKIVYKVHTPNHFGGTTGTTTISRAVASSEDYSLAFVTAQTITEPHTPEEAEPQTSSSDASYQFEYIAQIDWSVMKSARFRFGDGKEVLAADFFRKGTMGVGGRSV
jgi:hypothetical protein